MDAQPDLSGDLPYTRTFGPHRTRRLDFLRVTVLHPTTAHRLSFGFCPGDPRHHPLTDEFALELREYSQHLKHRPARGRRRVEALLMQEEIDALGVQLLQERQ